MASAQVDVVHVEDLTKSSEETTLGGSGPTEGSAKAPAPQNIESPYDEEPEDVIELGKEEELDDEDDKKPHIIEDEDDDEDEDDEEQATKSAVRANDFSEEEEGDDDV